MSKAKNKAQVMVTVGEGHLKRVKDVAKGLRAAGMEVEQVMEQLGTITGSVESAKKKSLSRVPGVEAVETAAAYQLPPPDSAVQ